MKKFFFYILKKSHWRKESDPEPDPLVRDTDPGIRIKLSRIPNIGFSLLQATLHIRRVVPRPPAAGGLQAPGVLPEPLRG